MVNNQLLILKNDPHKRNVVILVVFGFLLRLACLPFAEAIDADAVTRIFMAQEWWAQPHLIVEGVWPPFHEYLYGLLVGLSGDRIYTPIIFTMILSSLLAWPVYSLVRREFSERGAFWAALAVVLSPVLFHNSFHTLSGTVFLLCVAFSWNAFSLALREVNLKNAVYAGLWITLAAGFRYEAWLLIALFTGIGLLSKQWKLTAVYWCFVMIFPIFWMLGNYAVHGNFFYGLSGAYDWNIVQEGVNDFIPRDVQLLRWFFFPVSWLILFSPLLAAVCFIAFIKRWKGGKWNWNTTRWSVFFVVFAVVFVYKSNNGTLLTQHRFTGTLLLFSIPFIGLIWELERAKFLQLFAKIGIVTLIPLSYVWMQIPYEKALSQGTSTYFAVENFRRISKNSIPAVPRLKRKDLDEVKRVIAENTTADDGLILDFISWESTYNIALFAPVDRDHMFLFNGAKNAENYFGLLEPILKNYKRGCLVIKKKSGLNKMLIINGDRMELNNESGITANIKKVGTFDDFEVYSYSR